jgi:allantoin racemase
MRILLINPNTSHSFTDKIQAIAEKYALPGTFVQAVNPETGPRSIESIYDELLSSPGTLEVALANLENYDAFVIACYSDHPTVYALREVTDKPVLGIAEASVYLACMLGHKFSVVTTNREWEPLLWDAVRHYGMAERCASVRSTGMPVLALESASPEETYQMILEASRQAIEKDGAEVICLGCAGMTGLDKRLEAELQVPVVDGVVGALKLLEGLVGYGLRTSKRLAYSQPGYKELVGYADIFSQPYKPGQPETRE